jgi:hypothetical protein
VKLRTPNRRAFVPPFAPPPVSDLWHDLQRIEGRLWRLNERLRFATPDAGKELRATLEELERERLSVATRVSTRPGFSATPRRRKPD